MVYSIFESMERAVEWAAFSLIPLGAFVGTFSLALFVHAVTSSHYRAEALNQHNGNDQQTDPQ
jgi:hypothetical protein